MTTLTCSFSSFASPETPACLYPSLIPNAYQAFEVCGVAISRCQLHVRSLFNCTCSCYISASHEGLAC